MPNPQDTDHQIYYRDVVFYRQVLIAVALCGVTVAMPFAGWHFIWGNPVITYLLLPVIGLQLVSLFLLIRHGFNQWIALFLASVQMGVTVIINIQMGVLGSYWVIASAVANYYIVSRNMALGINLIACITVLPLAFESGDIMFRFAMANAMINVFLYAYARQLETKNRELEELLTKDPLTRAGNRTALENALIRVKNQHLRHNTPVTVLMLDLDHFKKINDTEGHTAGDKVLKRLADLLRARLRATDSLFRYGGEEFVIVADNTTLDQAAYLAEDIRRRVEKANELTVSIGLAELQSGESTEDVVSRADQALYKAKQMGRNWVCFDPV
ncbi:MAG: hypothetical protein CMK70_04030 [Pseudohongiella sp.]|nr:hypothetical protein [Pseudohongiella sp.]|tara:strand:+ start:2714 stop:3697 length:984 start_codon:yes stop_codon:yes gene_type:complete